MLGYPDVTLSLVFDRLLNTKFFELFSVRKDLWSGQTDIGEPTSYPVVESPKFKRLGSTSRMFFIFQYQSENRLLTTLDQNLVTGAL